MEKAQSFITNTLTFIHIYVGTSSHLTPTLVLSAKEIIVIHLHHKSKQAYNSTWGSSSVQNSAQDQLIPAAKQN